MRWRAAASTWLVVCVLSGHADLSLAASSTLVDVPPGPLSAAIDQLARQTGAEILFDPALVRNLTGAGVRGHLTTSQALAHLIAGTSIGYRLTPDGAFVLFPLPVQKAAPEVTSIAEILVVGRRTQNVDIPRSENDIQPYKLITAQDLELIPYDSVDAVLRSRLTANAQFALPAQDVVHQPGSTRSQIDLRGLGVQRTLVLIDGQRLPGVPTSQNDFDQSDLNGVPIGAIERIETLTSTAGGIYGPGAVGGVVNVILKRDYRGADLTVAPGVSSRGDAAHARFEARVGFTPDNGATDVMIFGGYSVSSQLLVGDRDFAQRARLRQFTNNPTGFINQLPIGNAIAVYGFAPLSLDAANGGAALGSSFTFLPLNFTGTSAQRNALLLANAGKALVTIPSGPSGAAASLTSSPTVGSILFNVRHRFSNELEAFVDGLYFSNSGTAIGNNDPGPSLTSTNAPSNPFAQPVFFSFPDDQFTSTTTSRVTVGRLTIGLIATLPRQWAASADVALGRSVSATTFETNGASDTFYRAIRTGLPGATGLPALDPLGDYQTFRTALAAYLTDQSSSFQFEDDLVDASARAAGPLVQLPGGPLTLTVSGEARREHVPGADVRILGLNINTPQRTQTVLSGYGELRAPLVPKDNAPPLLRGLELQLAVRNDSVQTQFPAKNILTSPSNDQLTTVGHDATVFTAGFRVEPAQWLLLRGSVATGETPPQISQLEPVLLPGSSASGAIDPRRGGQSLTAEGPVTLVMGGSPRIGLERGVTVSFGGVLNPWSGGPRLSVDFSRIDIRKQIVDFPLTPAQLMLAEASYPDRVVRAPLTAADAALGFTAGRVIALDISAINAGRTQLDTVDFQLDWRFSTRFGQIRPYGAATWEPNFRQQLFNGEPWIQRVGYFDGPLAWRANAGLQFVRGPYTVDLNVQYFSSYSIFSSNQDSASIAENQVKLSYQGSPSIPSQTYVDLVVRRRFELKGTGPLKNLDLRFAILNLFDHSPPIDTTPGDVGYSLYGDPRRRRFELLLSAHF